MVDSLHFGRFLIHSCERFWVDLLGQMTCRYDYDDYVMIMWWVCDGYVMIVGWFFYGVVPMPGTYLSQNSYGMRWLLMMWWLCDDCVMYIFYEVVPMPKHCFKSQYSASTRRWHSILRHIPSQPLILKIFLIHASSQWTEWNRKLELYTEVEKSHFLWM